MKAKGNQEGRSVKGRLIPIADSEARCLLGRCHVERIWGKFSKKKGIIGFFCFTWGHAS